MTSLKDESFSENDIIDPFWIIRYLENHVPKDKVSCEFLVDTLKRMTRKIKGVKVTFYKTRSVKDSFVVNGFFDKEQKKSIEIQICSSAFKKKLTLTKKQYRAILYEIADALCHESIHRYQYKFKDHSDEAFKSGSMDQLYYGDPDEMFCFSVNIAHNLYRQYGIKSLEKLKTVKPLLRFDPYLSDYYAIFYNQPQFKKMLKMIYQNIIAIDQGRILYRDLYL
jgi:hypothetical protein